MDSLVQAMKDRIEESTKDGREVCIGQIMRDFISEGYEEDEVKKAYIAVLIMHSGNEYN